MAAESKDEAAAQLKERGLFVMSLGVFDHEVTPAWSTISLTSPKSIPSGDLLAQGLPSVLDQKGMTFPGSLNLRGVDGELHLVFGKPDARETIFDLPIRTISQVRQQGVFRKRLVITTSTLEEHVLRDSISEAKRLYAWAMFASETVARGQS